MFPSLLFTRRLSKRGTTQTSTAFCGGFAGRGRPTTGSFYLLERRYVAGARSPAVRHQARLLSEVVRDQLARRIEPAGRRARRIGDLRLALMVVVRSAPDLADEEIVLLFEKPDHAGARARTRPRQGRGNADVSRSRRVRPCAPCADAAPGAQRYCGIM